jgi:hypothetical protein
MRGLSVTPDRREEALSPLPRSRQNIVTAAAATTAIITVTIHIDRMLEKPIHLSPGSYRGNM